jgi:hypothetical protein
VIFRGKFRGISWKNYFSKLFSSENSIFSQHFWGKIFRGIFPEIFPGKKCSKNQSQDKICVTVVLFVVVVVVVVVVQSFLFVDCVLQKPWRSGLMVTASAYRTEVPGFESHQGLRFSGL